MSLLRRLNTETAMTAPAVTKPASSMLSGTSSISTGELFNRPPQPGTSGLPSAATTTLLPSAQTRPSQTAMESASARPRLAPKQDSFTEMKARIQNRLVAELDPRMDLSNPDHVRRTVEETYSAV